VPAFPRELRRRTVLAAATGGSLAAAAVCGSVALAAFTSTKTAAATYSTATLSPPAGFSAGQSCVPTSTVAFRAASSNTSTAALTLAVPAGVQAGDVMVAQVAMRSAGTVAAPAGWTAVRNDSSGTQISSFIYYKVAGAVEPSSYAWTTTASRTAGGIAAYSGVSTTNPVDVSSGTNGSSTSLDAPSVTTTIANDMLVGFWTARQQSVSGTPASMTQRWSVTSGGGASAVGAAAADEAFAGPGATGTRSATQGSSFDWVAQLVALEPQTQRTASLSWTATSSTFASGYKLQRWVGSTQENQTQITPRTTTTATDATLANGTAYTFKLFAYYQSWTSSQASASLASLSC
jgi:hypothetical protein